VQHGGEDGALDRELKASAGEQLLDYRDAASLLPQSAEQQRAADATTGQCARRHLGENEAVLAVPGEGLQQAVKPAIAGEQVFAAEGLEDALADAAAGVADALDEIEVAVAAGGLLDDEHRTVLRIVYAQGKQFPCFPAQMFSPHPGAAENRTLVRSTTYARPFGERSCGTVQVR
jgi:hypothetical protein